MKPRKIFSFIGSALFFATLLWYGGLFEDPAAFLLSGLRSTLWGELGSILGPGYDILNFLGIPMGYLAIPVVLGTAGFVLWLVFRRREV